MLNHLVQIWRLSTPEESEEPEPEHRERTMTVSRLTEGFGLTEGSFKTYKDIDSNEQ
jgi:hypothetical protein